MVRTFSCRLLARIHSNQDGANLVEYALLLSMIVIGAVVAIKWIGGSTVEHIEAVQPGLAG